MTIYREWLDVGTVPTFKKYNIGTVPTFKKYNIGTVPMFKKYNIGTVPMFKKYKHKRWFRKHVTGKLTWPLFS